MKKTLLALSFLFMSVFASAQVFNKTVAPGAGVQAILEIDPVAGKTTVFDAICWSAASVSATAQTVMSMVVYNDVSGGASYKGLWSSLVPVAASSGLGGNVVPLYCTPSHMKFYGFGGADIYVYFTTAITYVAQSITVYGHYE